MSSSPRPRIASSSRSSIRSSSAPLIDGDAVRCDPDTACDLGGGRAVVAGHDGDPDSGFVAAGDSLGDLGPGRVEERDEAEQAQLALGVLAA